MNAHTQSLTLSGPAGAIEALLDVPEADLFERPHGTVVIAHPHPQFGGTMHNKVVQTIARACVHTGWRAVRFNFRGVGGSAGVYDEGRGEAGDMHAVVEQAVPADEPLALAGFSFGAYVTSQVIGALHGVVLQTGAFVSRPVQPAPRAVARAVLVGTAASRFAVPPLPATLHADTLVVHGEHDDTVPLAAVMNWARPQVLPVTVVPDGGHFFHGQLPLLKSLVMRHMRA